MACSHSGQVNTQPNLIRFACKFWCRARSLKEVQRALECLVDVTKRYVEGKARKFGFRVSSFEFHEETAHVQKRTQIYQRRNFRSPSCAFAGGGKFHKSNRGASKQKRCAGAGSAAAGRWNFNYHPKRSGGPECDGFQLEYSPGLP